MSDAPKSGTSFLMPISGTTRVFGIIDVNILRLFTAVGTMFQPCNK